MSAQRTAPRRQIGSPHASTAILIDLLPGTRAYTDSRPEGLPILVLDTGPAELQLTLPGARITLDDLRILDGILEAAAAYRTALIAHLD